MNKMSPELLRAIEQAEASRKRMLEINKNKVADRRISVVAIDHEERRQGPRRWVEKRALMAAQNVEKD